MNLQDDTIQLLVDLVEKEQRRLDQFQPDSQDYARRFHALMDRFTDDQPLRKELWGWRTSTVSSTAATSTSFSGPVSSWVWLWAVSPFYRTGKS